MHGSGTAQTSPALPLFRLFSPSDQVLGPTGPSLLGKPSPSQQSGRHLPPNDKEIPDSLPVARLDQILSDLPADKMVRGFVYTILSNRGQWCDNDESRIAPSISRFLTQVFSAKLSRSLQDELLELFPVGKPHALSLDVERCRHPAKRGAGSLRGLS